MMSKRSSKRERKEKRGSILLAEEYAKELYRQNSGEQEEPTNMEGIQQESEVAHSEYSFHQSQTSQVSTQFNNKVAGGRTNRPVAARTSDGYAAILQLFLETSSHSEELPPREAGKMQVRIGKTGMKGQTSLIRNKSYEVALGNGKVILSRDSLDQPISIPVVSLNRITYAKMSNKSFALRLEDGRVYWMRASKEDEAHRYVKGILEEVRIQATALRGCALQLMEESGESISEHSIESMLRESVDLFSLAKNFTHPDCTDAMEKLAKWLEKTDNLDEANYWFDWAGKARIQYNNESRQEDMGIDMNLTSTDKQGGLLTLQRKRAVDRGNNGLQINRLIENMLRVVTQSGLKTKPKEEKEQKVESML